MSKEAKNIFGWRKEIRELSPQKRAKWFYNQKLTPALEETVIEAERARLEKDHQTVEKGWNTWVGKGPRMGDQRILAKLRARERKLGISLAPEEDLLKAGFAGLGRISHVDANSQLKVKENAGTQDPILIKIEEIRNLYQRLGVETLAPWTIDGGSINWVSEIAQDEANTQTILRNSQEAEGILNQAIFQTDQLIKVLEVKVDMTTPEDKLRAEDYKKWKERKIYFGSVSALGPLWYRKAKISKKISDMITSLELVRYANRFVPNQERLITISFWTITSAISPGYSGSLGQRLKGMVLGITSLASSVLINPKGSFYFFRKNWGK